MLSQIIDFLYLKALSTPLELFAFFASMIEEVLPPIPVPSVITLVGMVAKMQEYSPYDLHTLIIIGAVGKTLGALALYYIVDKLEDAFVIKYGAYFNIQEDKLKTLGKKINGNARDYIILTLLRATPLVPSTLITIGCGLLQIPYKLFIISTFIGSLIRNSIYIYIGFTSITIFHPLFMTFVKIVLSIKIVLLLIAIGLLIYWIRRK